MVTIEPTLRRRVAKATALPESLDPLLRVILLIKRLTVDQQTYRGV